MIPELGKYAFAVLSSYGVSILLLVGLAWMSVQRARQAASRLEEGRSRMAPWFKPLALIRRCPLYLRVGSGGRLSFAAEHVSSIPIGWTEIGPAP